MEFEDPVTEVIRNCAKALIAKEVNVEVSELLTHY